MSKKSIRLLFKTGSEVKVLYSAKVFAELSENLGKDKKVEAKNFTVNTKDLTGVFFEVEEVEAPAEA